jgi:hypothetical protein
MRRASAIRSALRTAGAAIEKDAAILMELELRRRPAFDYADRMKLYKDDNRSQAGKDKSKGTRASARAPCAPEDDG